MSTHFKFLVHPKCHLRALLLHQRQHQSFYGHLDTSVFSSPQFSNIYTFYAVGYCASNSLMRYIIKNSSCFIVLLISDVKKTCFILFKQFNSNRTNAFQRKINHQRVFCISTQSTYVQSEQNQSFIIQKSLCKCIYLELVLFLWEAHT